MKRTLVFCLTLLCLLWLAFAPAHHLVAQQETPTATAEPLVLTAVQPNNASSGSSVELVATGSGFVDGAVVIVDGFGALTTSFVSSNLLRANLPGTIPSGVYSVTVVNPDARSVTLPNSLTITAPVVTAEPETPEPSKTPAPTAFVRPQLVVSSYGASSAEIVPGENLAFEMTLANAGSVRARNIVATFVNGSFIARDTGGVRAIGTLDPGQSNRFWQPLFASRDLAGQRTGVLEVDVSYTDDYGTAYSEKFSLSFTIAKVATGGAAPTPTPTATPTITPTAGPRLRPQMIITNYQTDVAQLEPGVPFSLQLVVQNQGNAAARRMTMILGGGSSSGGTISGTPEPGGLSGAGGSFTDFAPVGASNVQYLGDLPPGGSFEASQALIVNATTKPGAYPVKVSFVYNDDQNVSFVDDQVVTLLVYQRPLITFNFYSPVQPLFAGQPGPLPLQLVNGGKNTAVLGNFSVNANGATFDNNTIFVGNVEPGGFFPFDATVYPEQPGQLELLLSVSYTDDFNQPQVISQTLTVEVLEAFIPEEPIEPIPEEQIPVEPEPETFGQKVWRFLLGLFGLSSGTSQPTQPTGGEFIPPEGGGEFVPSPGESGPVQQIIVAPEGG
ncbi:MAG: IPT/TIG domain-containing protein [Ardenticatenaceae bacterium]|nr:IPT/TIG domain-containing protein [Ardenticatenaceae bacterium]